MKLIELFKRRKTTGLDKVIFDYDENSRRAKRTMAKIKKKAMDLHEANGKQYHIMPCGQGKVMIINNDMRAGYNKHFRKGKRKVTIMQIISMAYFSTPAGNKSI